MEKKTGMDDFLKQVERLSEVAARRESPKFSNAGIMQSVTAMSPDDELVGPGINFLAIFSAMTAAASVAFLLYVSSSWRDLNNPFFALDTILNAMEWL